MSLLEEVSPRGNPRIVFLGLSIIFVASLLNLALQILGRISNREIIIFYLVYVKGFFGNLLWIQAFATKALFLRGRIKSILQPVENSNRWVQ
jgi:hypothetical protein